MSGGMKLWCEGYTPFDGLGGEEECISIHEISEPYGSYVPPTRTTQ